MGPGLEFLFTSYYQNTLFDVLPCSKHNWNNFTFVNMIHTLIQQAGVIMSTSQGKDEENEAQTVKSLVQGCLSSIDGRTVI